MAVSVENVGFVGLGIMGKPMAHNLIKKLSTTATLWIFDISKESMTQLSQSTTRNICICSSPKEVAENTDIIFTMVPEGPHVKQVYLDQRSGLVTTSLESKILVDCSTIDTATSKLVSDEIKQKYPSAAFYDAPVSGGSLGAEKGTLTFMLGAAENDKNLALLKNLTGMMGTSVFVCGAPLMGLIAKLSNNYCSGIIAIGTAEALNMGMKAGMDPRVLARIFSTSTAQSTINDQWNPVPGICPEAPASKGYQGGFKVQLMKKDFDLAVKTAQEFGARLALGDAGLKTYTDASNDSRCRDLDSRVVYRYLGGDEEWLKRISKN